MLEDDALSCVSSEMGRRKLPSIPTQRTEKASSEQPAPVYLTSSNISLPSSPSERQYFLQDTNRSRPASRASSLSDLSRSSITTASTYRGVDPAIIPGAVIPNVRQKTIRQTTSTATGGRSNTLGQSSSRMPSTLARVLLKKELKEVLERRREALEACEIEANQREFVVHRMLITGLLPEHRSADIDDIPNVIHCLLPVELVNGAKIVPSGERSTNTSPLSLSMQTDETSRATQGNDFVSKIENAVCNDDLEKPKVKSIAIQVEYKPHKTKQFASFYRPSQLCSSLSAPKTPQEAFITTKSKFQSTGTQTNGITSNHYESSHKSPVTGRSHEATNSGDTYVSSSEPNLLESTAKYFAEYDRQLREHGRRLKNRFAFSDDDPISRESKKQRLISELAQRKEKISSMADLSNSLNHSDYSSTVPHYGSLPIIDFPASSTTHSLKIPRDFKKHGKIRYGSLPRNYERHMDNCAYEPSCNSIQPFGIRQYDVLSRSLHDLSRSYDDISDPRIRIRNTSSFNHLPQNDAYDVCHGIRSQFINDSCGRHAYPEYLSLEDAQNPMEADMISQYANYLSNEFMNNQRKLLAEYGTDIPSAFQRDTVRTEPYPNFVNVYGTAPSNLCPDRAIYIKRPLNEYEKRTFISNHSASPILRSNFHPIHSIQQSSYQPVAASSQMQYPFMPSVNYVPPTGSNTTKFPPYFNEVYSRNEVNYGSRPLYSLPEYGNFHRNRFLKESDACFNGNFGPLLEIYGNSPENHGALRDQQYRPYFAQNAQNLQYSYKPITNYPFPLDQQIEQYSMGNNRRFGNLSCNYGRAWLSNGNLPMSTYYDAIYPKENAKGNFATTSRLRPFRSYQTGNAYTVSSLGRNERRSRKNRFRVNGTQSVHAFEENDNYRRRTKCRDRSLSISTERWRDANNSSDGRRYRSESLNGERRQEVPVSSNYHFRYHTNNIKRILLTRKYRDTNIYNDLGIRVTGGKKLWNGDLGAFISAINRNRSKELLGEIKEGDQVLEWNGILLTGKTFEEVERIIGASKGEIEVVIKSTTSERPTRQILKNLNYSRDSVGNDSRSRKNYDETSDYQKEAPPVPVHRCIDGRASPEFDYYPPTAQFIQNFPSRVVANETNANYHELTSLGYLNIALSYDASISTLFITVLSAKGLTYRQYYNTTFYPNPFVKIYLLPGRKVSNKRRTKFVPNSIDPIWNQTIEYIIYPRELYGHYLEFTVWDYDKINENNSLGQVVISLSEPYILNGVARWYPLQAMHQNFVVSGFPGLQFQTVIPSKNTFQSVQQYNPATLDISYPVIG